MKIIELDTKEIDVLKRHTKWEEGVALLGYWRKGDSFLFGKSEDSNFVFSGGKKTIFCISRRFLKKLITKAEKHL